MCDSAVSRTQTWCFPGRPRRSKSSWRKKALEFNKHTQWVLERKPEEKVEAFPRNFPRKNVLRANLRRSQEPSTSSPCCQALSPAGVGSRAGNPQALGRGVLSVNTNAGKQWVDVGATTTSVGVFCSSLIFKFWEVWLGAF